MQSLITIVWYLVKHTTIVEKNFYARIGEMPYVPARGLHGDAFREYEGSDLFIFQLRVIL